METNETAKGAQYREAEQELMKLLEEVEGLEEGDLKGLEQKIYQGIFNIGRKVMEGKPAQLAADPSLRDAYLGRSAARAK